MAKRMTREEKQAAAVEAQRQRDVNEIKERAARARGLRTYTEKAAWDMLTGGDKSLGALWELVRMFDSANDDLRKRIASLAEEMTDALRRHDDGRRYVFGGSYAIGNNGAEIERLDAKRQALADAVAMTARATGWFVPQVYDGAARLQHTRLATLEVVARANNTFHIMCEGKALTGVDLRLQPANAAEPLVSEYTSEDSAWLAAAAYVGRH